MRASSFVAIGFVGALGCASSGGGASAPAQDPWGPVGLVPAADLDPSPNVVEVNVVARVATHVFPGAAPTPVWTYDGTIPGTFLDAKVGDELVVHLTNRLPEETTIHWHGVRVPNVMDGVMGVTPPTMPGETTTYRFTLRDAGLFWYHPHVRSDEQVNKGLYGVLRVRGASEPSVDHEGVVVLDDIGLLEDGTIPTYLDDDSKMMGRGGDVLLFNGASQPTLPWRAGSLERLRFVNAANGRFFNLRLEGYSFRVIGTDGGLLEHPYDADRVLIPPGKRYDVVVIPKGAPGTETVLWTDAYDRGHDSGKEAPKPVARFRISGEAPLTGRALPTSFAPTERLVAPAVADHVLEFDEALAANGDPLFTINGKSGKDVPMIMAPRGAVRRFALKNLSEMDHPFHLHGFFFQVLERNGVPAAADRLANEDTIVVPAKSSLSFVTRFDEPGLWPYHCHILEHAEAGMMGMIDVAP